MNDRSWCMNNPASLQLPGAYVFHWSVEFHHSGSYLDDVSLLAALPSVSHFPNFPGASFTFQMNYLHPNLGLRLLWREPKWSHQYSSLCQLWGLTANLRRIHIRHSVPRKKTQLQKPREKMRGIFLLLQKFQWQIVAGVDSVAQ